MNRAMTALLSAAEAALVAAVGLAVVLAPLTTMWGLYAGFQIEWVVFLRASLVVWLLGHGVDVVFTLDPVTAASLGVVGAELPFPVTGALLGFAVLTVLLGVRAGRRIAATAHRLTGEVTGTAVFAGVALLVTWGAGVDGAVPSFWQGVLLPTAVYAGALLVGTTGYRMRHPADTRVSRWVRDRLRDVPVVVLDGVAAAFRGGVAAAALVVAVAGVLVGALLLFGYADVVALYEALHAGILGGAVLTLAQLALLPAVVGWGASWLVGPGFALGTGSTVSPLATAVGPVPAIPLLGALPTDPGPWAFGWLAVPVAAGVIAGLLAGARVARRSWLVRIVSSAGAGVVGGVLLGLVAWASSGSFGPGRLVEVGPDPLVVGGVAAAEFAVGALIGLLCATVDARTLLRRGGVRPEREREPADR